MQEAAGAGPGLDMQAAPASSAYTGKHCRERVATGQGRAAAACWPPLMPAYAEAAFTVYIFLATARVFESFISAALLKAGERWKFISGLRKEPRRKKCLVAAVMGGGPGDSAGDWEIKQLRNGFVGRSWGILSR